MTETAGPKMIYDYAKAKAHCAKAGLGWHEFLAERADQTFAAADLTQHQVDRVMVEHIEAVRFLFEPRNYPFWGRVALGLHFWFRPFKSSAKG